MQIPLTNGLWPESEIRVATTEETMSQRAAIIARVEQSCDWIHMLIRSESTITGREGRLTLCGRVMIIQSELMIAGEIQGKLVSQVEQLARPLTPS